MANLFISYARPTLTQARLITESLRAAGHKVWIDEDLLAHRSFVEAIEEHLDAADAAIVVWSPDAVRSSWVRSEASRARQAGKLVQVRLERCALPMPFDQIHYVDLSSWSGDPEAPVWRSVLASVAAVTGAHRPGPHFKPADNAPPSAGGERHNERRQVTALFCDLMDSGSLAARLDPEDMMQVLDVYQAMRDDVIASHGGATAESTGHGAIAYFGYPHADEDEAANAVRARIALCDAAGRQDLPARVVLRTRVGVATGLVVIADLARGGGARQTGVVGETPNLAAQLASTAPPNGVVVSEATRRITDGLFTYRDLGPTVLQGYDAPTRAFEVLGATAVASRSQARAHGGRTSLFGRETELALMLQCWDLACEGEGQVVLVQGEAGIGKSQLVESFRRRLGDAGNVQTTWYCAPNYRDTALHPIVEQLARAADFERGEPVEARRRKLARLLDELSAASKASYGVWANLVDIHPEADDPVAALTPEKRKAVTLDTLLAMMDHLASDHPALFVVEDLHWADATTLELLDRATRQAADRRLLILTTARPEFEPRWSDHADVIHVQLGRLNKVDAGRICTALGADALLPAETLREIIARSDGIPLFVEEMTKSVLEAAESAPKADGLARLAIPNTLHDSLAARLDRLGSAKSVASLGATIGRRFGYELLTAVAPQPAAELRQALRELTRSGLVERSGVPPNSHYMFKHALIRDAAYESLLKRERETLHGRIARAIQERFPETLKAEPALVAYHLTEGGALAEAIPFWVEAGRRAAAQAAHVEAVSRLNNALDLIRRLPATDDHAELELQLLLGLAVSLSASQGYSIPQMVKVLADARAICDRLGNVADLFAVLRLICSFAITASDLAAAEEATRRCMEISEQTGLPLHQIEAAGAMSMNLAMKSDLPAARAHAERAISVYQENDGENLQYIAIPGKIVLCRSILPLILYAMGDNLAAERTAGEAHANLHTLGRTFDLAFATSWLATYNIIKKEYATALDFAEQSLQICEENNYDTYTAVALAAKAFALGRLGELTTALEMAARGIGELGRLGVNIMLSYHLTEFADLQAAAGEMAAALSTVDRAIAHALQFNDRFYLSKTYRVRAELLAQMPGADHMEVRAALREAVAAAQAQGATGFAAQARSLLADLAA